jgi:hypothetical protein
MINLTKSKGKALKHSNWKRYTKLVFVLMTFIQLSGLAQEVNIEIYLTKVKWSGYMGDEGGPRLKFFRNNLTEEDNIRGHNGCVGFDHSENGDKDLVERIGSFKQTTPQFTLIVETWEKRKSNSNDCGYHTSSSRSDKFYRKTENLIDLNNYPRGQWFEYVIKHEEGESLLTATLRMIYDPPVPNFPNGGQGINCSNAPYTLTSDSNLGGFINATGLKYEWQYNISGDDANNPIFHTCMDNCSTNYESCVSNPDFGQTFDDCTATLNRCNEICNTSYPSTIPIWRELGSSTGNSFTFLPVEAIFKNIVRANTNVRFRVRAKGPDALSDYSSPSQFFTFSTPSPSSSSIIITESSCAESPTGKITLDNINSSFPTYRYLLKKGPNPVLDCEPEKGNCLKENYDSGEKQSSEKRLELNNLKPGIYSLFLLNSGSNQGTCPRRAGTVEIKEIAGMVATVQNPVHVTCNNTNNGSITFSMQGGRQSNIKYSLRNTTTNDFTTKTSSTTNPSITFDQLKPGNYTLNIADNCSKQIDRMFQITQPVKVSKKEFETVATSCNNPGNGIARITVQRSSGTFDKSESTTLLYQLYNNNILIESVESSEMSYTWSALPESEHYKIIAKEKGGQDCNGAIEEFSIKGPVPLNFASLVVDKVTCFSGTDGAIHAQGIGGSGKYVYILETETGREIASDSPGEFSGLTAGLYTLSVKSDNDCNDRFSKVITLQQPTQLEATISGKDISCYGMVDGEVSVSVTGGTAAGDYHYAWEQQLGQSWVQRSNTSQHVTGLEEGNFRVVVSDDAGCKTLSRELKIVEPAALSIAHVQLTDIRCMHEKGNIAITGAGGVKPYTFSYRKNDETLYSDFDGDTPLETGHYTIRIRDNNGCMYLPPERYAITTPAAPLAFTETRSDYNGFNISCFQGSNGYAILTPSGGNGAQYVGYEFAVDNGTFQKDNKIQGLAAGDHILRVRDERGCEISKTLYFSQTDAILASKLLSQKDIVCYDGSDGEFLIAGQGGLPPYLFGIEKSDLQPSGNFSGLTRGSHTITVQDKNGCRSSASYSINSMNAEIVVTTAIRDVLCYGGTDGSVTASVAGGVSPYRYSWTGTSTTPRMDDVSAGTYTLTLTDNAGCVQKTNVIVHQPVSALQTTISTIPVCFKRNDGSITLDTRGGTAPYRYSLNDGPFQNQPAFVTGAGDYTITIQDSHGCMERRSTTISVRSDKPDPNFLAATTRSALDTLAIVDISVPKPDSIHWLFDPQAVVVKNDAWSPQLLFNDAGTYTVSMTGYFNACAYTITKAITLAPYDASVVKEKLPGYRAIQSIAVTPNPSSGEIELTLTLSRKYKLSVIVFDVLGVQHYNRSWSSVDALKEKIVLDNVASGVYMLRAITEHDAEDIRLIINK